MMIYPSMIGDAAEKAGMKVPDDPDEDFNREDFPHFAVFCALQLCRPIQWGEHWENAKVVASFSEEEVKTASLDDFLAKGLIYST